VKISELVAAALLEDDFRSDVTTQSLDSFIDSEQKINFSILAKSEGVFSGLKWLQAFSDFQYEELPEESQSFQKGERIILGRARLKDIFSIERSLLNGLQNFCGVATQTKKICEKVTRLSQERSLKVTPKIYHTRKTLPLLRELQIDAALAGGAHLHRHSLSHRKMFKDNHKEVLAEYGVSYAQFASHELKENPDSEALFEVDSLVELKELLGVGVSFFLLDNFSESSLEEALKLKKSGISYELSGGISYDTLDAYVIEGVDRISLGALTHSVRPVDLSFEWRAKKT